MKKIQYFLIVLVILVSFFDIFFASRSKFLEANPIHIYVGFYGLVIIKAAFTVFVCYLIYNNRYRTEKHLFTFSATLILIFLLWGYGIGTGILGGILYQSAEQEHIEVKNQELIEERGYEATQEEVAEITQNYQQSLQQATKKQAIPYYTRVVWLYGIYPFVFSVLSFAIFRRLYRTAKFRKMIIKREEDENKTIY